MNFFFFALPRRGEAKRCGVRLKKKREGVYFESCVRKIVK